MSPRARVRLFFGILAGLAGVISPRAIADSLVSEWSSVSVPAMPPLVPVSADAATTALFMISMTQETCNAPQRPRCAATVPGIAKLLERARDHRLLIIHSLTRGGSTRDRLVPLLAPREGEPVLPPGPGPDKFIDSDLDAILKGHGVKTLIVVGTQAQTAVLHTGAGAAFRGYRVIVPIDGMSSDTAFPELYTA